MPNEHEQVANGNNADWRMYIMKRLDKIQDTQTGILVGLGQLQIKSGIWGMIGAALTLLGAWLLSGIF